MNEIVNMFLLAGDNFMPEMHLKQLGFTYSACGPFTKSKERIQTFILAGNADYTKLSLMKFVSNMMWLMVNINI